MNTTLHRIPGSTTEPAFSTRVSAGLSELTQSVPGIVLLVSSLVEDHLELQRIAERTCWRMCRVHSYRDALAGIAREQPDVVLCDADRADGDWRELLAETSGWLNPPYLIVTSRLADDHMWAEVLNLGAYDLLIKPLDAMEVYRVVGFACQRHQEEHNRTKH